MTTTHTYRSTNRKRQALAYEDVREPGVWRVRFELYPEHGDAATGWFGGRVSMRLHWDEAEAQHVAQRWTEDGELPAGLDR